MAPSAWSRYPLSRLPGSVTITWAKPGCISSPRWQTAAAGRVLTTLNPAGMDVENWQAMGISPAFAAQQQRVIEAFASMGVITTCTCTPYLTGNLPRVWRAHRLGREQRGLLRQLGVGGAHQPRGRPQRPGCRPDRFHPGLRLCTWTSNRRPTLVDVQVECPAARAPAFGAWARPLAKAQRAGRSVPYITGIPAPAWKSLKSFCASLATYGGAAMFHMPGITPEAGHRSPPAEITTSPGRPGEAAWQALSDASARGSRFCQPGLPAPFHR
jgi:hypothetical protein